MAKQNTNTKQGFTIIEVVLVLAIAGLIFLMVFIAWPALQRSQRDTQRRNDYAMLSTAVSNFITNNGGKIDKLVTITDPDEKAFINESGQDPKGNDYELKFEDCKNETAHCKNSGNVDVPNESKVFVVVQATCDGVNAKGGTAPKKTTARKSFAVYGYLEGGSGSFCTVSQ